MIKQIRAHALAHYEEGGWDILVECWDDSDIQRELDYLTNPTLDEAIKAIGEGLGVVDDVRKDIQATAW